MEQDLRILIGKYGFKALHEGLLKEMRIAHEYLMTVFPHAKNDIIVPCVSDTIPEPMTTPQLNPLDTIVVMKEMQLPESVTTAELHDEAPEDEHEEKQQDPTIKEVQIIGKVTEKSTTKRRFDKDEQKAEVLKKRKELETQGIKPESLLTKENLTKWLDEGMSYQRIAREYVGVSENEVSAVAKAFGLQSNISKFLFAKKAK